MIKEKLGNLMKIKTGKLDANASSIDGKYPFFTCSREPLKISSYSYDCKCVLVAGNGDLNVKYYEGKFDAYQRTYIIESKNEAVLDTRYLYWFLSKYVEKLRKLSIGGVIKYIKLKNLTDPIIPLPLIDDQKRIVKMLDRAYIIQEKRKRAIELLDDYLKSLFVQMFGDPVKNQKGWKRIPLSDILSKIESGHSPVCHDRKAMHGEWGVLKLGAITKCVYNPNENKALPDIENPNPEIEIKPGDLLFSRKNTYELVAACVYVWKTPPKLMMSDLIFRLVPRDGNSVNSIFLQALLSFPSKRKMIQRLAGGAAGSMPNISKARLLAHRIEVPPISLQNEFAEVMQKTEALKQKMISQSEELEKQFQALMQNVFNGKL